MSRQTAIHAQQNSSKAAKADGGLLRRKCACGTHTIGGASCDACRGESEKPQRAAVNTEEASKTQTDAQPRTQTSKGFGHDFSRVPLTAPVTTGGGAHAVTTRHTQVFNATVRRVRAQSDSTGGNDGQRETPSQTETQTPAAKPEGETGGTEGGKKVRTFEHLPPVEAGASEDTISATLSYNPSITNVNPPRSPGKFGETKPFIAVNRSRVTPGAGVFNLSLVVDNNITYWVHNGGRTNIASDSDPAITQTNYPTVVSDLTPSPAAVSNATANLLKNQPPRTRFWAEDITHKHERFHAGEDVTFGRQGAIAALRWINTQTASSDSALDPLVQNVAVMTAAKITQEMAAPASENRAYNDGAPDYTARAQAINTKGNARGYVPQPQPPAPQPSNPAPQPPTPAPPPSNPAPQPPSNMPQRVPGEPLPR